MDEEKRIEEALKAKVAEVKFAPPASLRDKVEADFARVHRRRRWLFWWLFPSGVLTVIMALWLWPSAMHSSDRVLGSESIASSLSVSPAASEVPESNRANVQNSETLENSTNDSEPKEIGSSENDPGPSTTNSSESEVDNTQAENIYQSGSGIATSDLSQEDELQEPQNVSVENDLPLAATDYTSLQAMLMMPPALLEEPTKSFGPLSSRNDGVFTATLDGYENEPANCPRWIIGLTGGSGWSYRTLHSNVHHQLVDHKNSSEHAAISTSAGITAVYTVFGRTGIKGGLTYLKVGERYHFENDHAAHETTNTYDYFNIDLKLNQTLICKPRWRLDLAAGTKINLLNAAQSSWLDPTSFEATAHDNEGADSPFRENNLVWSADVSAYYFIGRRMFIGSSIEADRFQNSVYRDEVELDQRPYAFQFYINLGIRL